MRFSQRLKMRVGTHPDGCASCHGRRHRRGPSLGLLSALLLAEHNRQITFTLSKAETPAHKINEDPAGQTTRSDFFCAHPWPPPPPHHTTPHPSPAQATAVSARTSPALHTSMRTGAAFMRRVVLRIGLVSGGSSRYRTDDEESSTPACVPW